MTRCCDRRISFFNLRSGPAPRVNQTPKPQEQNGEQVGEHRPKEDAHGTPAGGTGAGTGSWVLNRKRRNRGAGMGR